VKELLRFTPQFLAARGDRLGDFIWPLPEQPFQQEVQHHSENSEGYDERYGTERLTNQTPKGQSPDNQCGPTSKRDRHNYPSNMTDRNLPTLRSKHAAFLRPTQVAILVGEYTLGAATLKTRRLHALSRKLDFE